MNASTRFTVALHILTLLLPLSAKPKSDEKQIKDLIATYATTIDRADSAMAEAIFSNTPEVSFINPRGEDRGRQQIVNNVVKTLMGGNFSARKLTPKGHCGSCLRRYGLVGVQLGFRRNRSQGRQPISLSRSGNADLSS